MIDTEIFFSEWEKSLPPGGNTFKNWEYTEHWGESWRNKKDCVIASVGHLPDFTEILKFYKYDPEISEYDSKTMKYLCEIRCDWGHHKHSLEMFDLIQTLEGQKVIFEKDLYNHCNVPEEMLHPEIKKEYGELFKYTYIGL